MAKGSYYHLYFEGWTRTLEFISLVPLGTVVYYDGEVGHVVARGLQGPNGIYMKSDGR